MSRRERSAGRIWIGCSGWNYAHWRDGVFYPPRTPSSKWLRCYAQHFPTVEVNATFYRLPRRETVARWVAETPEEFVFSIKVSRYLTHVVRLRETGRHLGLLLDRIEPLLGSPKLGPLLWQLPPTFRRDDARLAAALAELPSGLRHAIEFRHESWFADEVLDLLRQHRVALVIADGPKVRSFQRYESTTDFAFVRLHNGARGRRGNYSPGELAEWADRIREWAGRGEVFVYFNNDWEGFAPANAAALRSLLSPADCDRRGDVDSHSAGVYRAAGRGTRAPTPDVQRLRRGAEMSEITTPRELFLHELGDILYVERALADEALPKLIGEVQDDEFRSGLEQHLEQTRRHVKNVESVFESLGEEPDTEPCLGFEGLKQEHDKMVEETAAGLIDLVDVGAAARTENYEIAAYESLRRMAKGLGEDKAVELLDANLKDEKETLREVEKIATRLSNEHAKQEAAA